MFEDVEFVDPLPTPPCVLLVEDDVGLADALESVLVVAGFDVQWANTVAGALHALDSFEVEVVVTDFELPDGSGCRVAGVARDQGVPVVAATGRGEAPVRALLQDAGVHAVLLKPFGARELREAVASALR